jgi:hypothetical protein
MRQRALRATDVVTANTGLTVQVDFYARILKHAQKPT